jgi:hypothetical protein
MTHLKVMRQNSVEAVGLVAVLTLPLFLPLFHAKMTLMFYNLGCTLLMCCCVGIFASVLEYIGIKWKGIEL